MTLVEKYALLPDEIDRESLKMVQASLPPGLRMDPREHYVLCRIVRAEGDPAIASDVRFSPGAVETGLDALRAGSPVVTDVRMVEMGISKALLRGAGLEHQLRHRYPGGRREGSKGRHDAFRGRHSGVEAAD